MDPIAASLSTYDPHPCVLGEGILWNRARNSLLWVDIDKRLLMERRATPGSDHATVWHLGYQVTALAATAYDEAEIWMLTTSGLVQFNLETGEVSPLGHFKLPEHFRPNDGNPGPGGRYWFGSMQTTPDTRAGKLFSVGIEGDYRLEASSIGIPNTFVTATEPDTLYVSDSMVQHIYTLQTKTGIIRNFVDLSGSAVTPDGGALDSEGNLWIAMWDGHAVDCYSKSGDKLRSILLPVPRPTNCCFGGQDLKTLFITSAREGLNEEMLTKYPLSGSVFCIDLDVAGAELPIFGQGS